MVMGDLAFLGIVHGPSPRVHLTVGIVVMIGTVTLFFCFFKITRRGEAEVEWREDPGPLVEFDVALGYRIRGRWPE